MFGQARKLREIMKDTKKRNCECRQIIITGFGGKMNLTEKS